MGSAFRAIASSCGEGCYLWLLFGEKGVLFGVLVKVRFREQGLCIVPLVFVVECVVFEPFLFIP